MPCRPVGRGVRALSLPAPRAKAQLTRSDFGISYNAALETGGVLVSDEIALEFDISAVRS